MIKFLFDFKLNLPGTTFWIETLYPEMNTISGYIAAYAANAKYQYSVGRATLQN